jgi:hypothetical protein
VSFSKKEKCKNYNAVGNLVGKVLLRFKKFLITPN